MKLKAIRKTEEEVSLKITGATLLSIEEAEALPNYLRRYHNCWWWLQSPGYGSDHTAVVGSYGSVFGSGNYVCYDNGVVRPALKIKNSNLKIGDSIFFGDKEFEIISEELAFCKSDIGNHCFREKWKAKDANDYEKSDVKRFVDKWFEKAINEMERQTVMDKEKVCGELSDIAGCSDTGKVKIHNIDFDKGTVPLPFEIEISNPDGKKPGEVLIEVMVELIKGFISRYTVDRGDIIDEQL